MNRLLGFLLMAPAVAGLTLTADIMAQDEASQVSREGLQLVEKDNRGELYANPDVEWSRYTQIQLQEAPVSFRRHWQKDQNRTDPFKVDARDMEKIRNSLSELFRQVFTEELTKNGGYTMATSPGEQVMMIKPAIVDLDVVAPDTDNAGYRLQYTDSSGRMTLKLELYDSVTGELLATASVRMEDPRRGYLEWTTSASNRADAQRLLRKWAVVLRQKLDKASNHPPPSAEVLNE